MIKTNIAKIRLLVEAYTEKTTLRVKVENSYILAILISD
jgi:hypothetical protein